MSLPRVGDPRRQSRYVLSALVRQLPGEGSAARSGFPLAHAPLLVPGGQIHPFQEHGKTPGGFTQSPDSVQEVPLSRRGLS